VIDNISVEIEALGKNIADPYLPDRTLPDCPIPRLHMNRALPPL
jgi:hypothetical protein